MEKQKRSRKKWKNREYHVQNDEDVDNKYVKMYCTTTQFPELPFCVPNKKPHSVRRLGKHHHMRFDTKLDYRKCAICCITGVYTKLTSRLEKPGPQVCHHINNQDTILSMMSHILF